MGIVRGTARQLLEEHRQRPFGGSILQLGKSFVFFGHDELAGWAREHGVSLADVPVRASHDPSLAATGCIDDVAFFELLGFERVESSDATRWEGADHVLDLNRPLPAEMAGRYDVVFEAGTLQHVFDVPRALHNVHELLRPGGRAIHGLAPANDHVDHGFYSFSPTLFHDFYRANGYRIEAIRLIRFLPFWLEGRLDHVRWDVHEYVPGCLDHLSYGRFGAQAGIFVVATRLPDATGDRIPQQSYYERIWEERPDAGEGHGAPRPTSSDSPPTGRPSGAYGLLRPLKAIREKMRRLGPRRLPPLVARY